MSVPAFDNDANMSVAITPESAPGILEKKSISLANASSKELMMLVQAAANKEYEKEMEEIRSWNFELENYKAALGTSKIYRDANYWYNGSLEEKIKGFKVDLTSGIAQYPKKGVSDRIVGECLFNKEGVAHLINKDKMPTSIDIEEMINAQKGVSEKTKYTNFWYQYIAPRKESGQYNPNKNEIYISDDCYAFWVKDYDDMKVCVLYKNNSRPTYLKDGDESYYAPIDKGYFPVWLLDDETLPKVQKRVEKRADEEEENEKRETERVLREQE